MLEWLNSSLGTSMGWGDILGAGAALGGSYLQYKGQKEAAEQIANATGQSVAEVQRAMARQEAMQRPLIEARQRALPELMGLMGVGTRAQQEAAQQGITSSAGYQTGLRQAMQAADTSATVPGGLGLRSSNQAVARAAIAPQLLESERASRMAGLSNLVGLGSNAANTLGASALNTGSGLANLFSQQGAGLAGATANRANLLGTSLGQLGGFLGMGGFSGRGF